MRLLLATKPVDTQHKFPHVTITEGAFSPEIERDLMFYTEWFEKLKVSSRTKILCKLIITSILEKVSYTRKDGQYLRWDYRSEKVRKANSVRIESGKPPIQKIDKGDLPNVKEALIKTFQGVFVDISILQKTYIKNGSMQKLIKGNTLEVLPTLESNKYDGVITSPPYANRYDYTRTYALELAYLSMGTQINSLRQSLLSCTVESHSKIQILQDYYYSIDQSKKYDEILEILNTNPVLQEVNNALKIRWERGDMNNRGVLRMIEQYFQELTFVFAELFRISKTGSHIAFVNDNVRYGGEIIPVDTITTNLAEIVGFEPTKIYVLAQKKGNSSQQMERFGRAELRKSITIWRKP
jgi:site-specific DNA-methyltransferase (cytosine-N4-specific)